MAEQEGATKKSKRRVILVLLAVIGFCWWITDYNVAPPGPRQAKTESPAGTRRKEPALSLVGDVHWGSDEFGGRYLYGAVRNNSAETLPYAQITFDLYDKSGARVGTAMANIENLGATQEWKFNAPVLEDTASSASLGTLSALP